MSCHLKKIKCIEILIILATGVFMLSACITPNGPTATYRSDDYIIHKLQKDESPSDLAKHFLNAPDKAWMIKAYNPNVDFEKGETIVIPLKDTMKGGIRSNGYQTVPVLCYHQFSTKCDSNLCVEVGLFEKQMKYLYDNGYSVIRLSDLIKFHNYQISLPPKSVVITIDDGYQSVYKYAYPILKKYNFTATIFIYTNYVNIGQAMSWEQLAELKKAGFEIGSHTVTHSDLTKLKEGESQKAYLARLKKEIFGSKKIIDAKFNQNTEALAFPYGKYNDLAVDLCKKAGYKLGLLVKRGNNPFYADPFTLRRNMIIRRGMGYFKARIKTFHKISLN